MPSTRRSVALTGGSMEVEWNGSWLRHRPRTWRKRNDRRNRTGRHGRRDGSRRRNENQTTGGTQSAVRRMSGDQYFVPTRRIPKLEREYRLTIGRKNDDRLPENGIGCVVGVVGIGERRGHRASRGKLSHNQRRYRANAPANQSESSGFRRGRHCRGGSPLRLSTFYHRVERAGERDSALFGKRSSPVGRVLQRIGVFHCAGPPPKHPRNRILTGVQNEEGNTATLRIPTGTAEPSGRAWDHAW